MNITSLTKRNQTYRYRYIDIKEVKRSSQVSPYLMKFVSGIHCFLILETIFIFIYVLQYSYEQVK